jgi:nicotinamidase-related amidase
MMATLTLVRQHTALLIADFYTASMSTLPHAVDRQVVEHTQRLQHVAREAGLLLCYCATVFRPGYVEISERNKTFSARKHSGQPPISEPVELIHPAVRPAAGEVVVGKHRVNALHGTALDLILRANARDTLILLGYATSGVVLSTIRAAADLDYRLIVVADCCADQDADVHDFLTQRIFPRQAEVVTSSEVIQALTA